MTFSRVPVDRMSAPAKRFCLQLLELTTEKLKATNP